MTHLSHFMSQHLTLFFWGQGLKLKRVMKSQVMCRSEIIFQLNAREVSYKHRMLEMVWMLLSLLSLPSTWEDLNETMDGQVFCFTYSSEIPQDIQGWDALQSRVLVSQKSKHFLTPKKYCEILSALPTSLPYPSNAKSTTSVGKSHPFIEDLPLKIMEKLSLMGTFPYIFLRVSSIFCRCSPLPSGKLT